MSNWIKMSYMFQSVLNNETLTIIDGEIKEEEKCTSPIVLR